MSERRSQYGYEELLSCARGELFGPGNAQLPLPPMLMFDRISEIAESGGAHGKGVIRAELDVIGHRDEDEMLKDADTDFPEPGSSPEHSGEDR